MPFCFSPGAWGNFHLRSGDIGKVKTAIARFIPSEFPAGVFGQGYPGKASVYNQAPVSLMAPVTIRIMQKGCCTNASLPTLHRTVPGIPP